MGSESSNSESNSSRSDSDSSSNSGNTTNKLEEMICKKENENTIINRVWIVKRSISLDDRHVAFVFGVVTITSMLLNKYKKNYINKVPKPFFKHWAIILELNNGSYVNIQSGRNGFSLKEFIKTNIEGENILNSILETWGEITHPFSFCYL